jgi:hypothetical protein
MLPLFVTSGDDGNYAQTAASDLSLLQVSKISHSSYFKSSIMYVIMAESNVVSTFLFVLFSNQSIHGTTLQLLN